jgi:hypothetical protein
MFPIRSNPRQWPLRFHLGSHLHQSPGGEQLHRLQRDLSDTLLTYFHSHLIKKAQLRQRMYKEALHQGKDTTSYSALKMIIFSIALLFSLGGIGSVSATPLEKRIASDQFTSIPLPRQNSSQLPRAFSTLYFDMSSFRQRHMRPLAKPHLTVRP